MLLVFLYSSNPINKIAHNLYKSHLSEEEQNPMKPFLNAEGFNFVAFVCHVHSRRCVYKSTVESEV